MWEPWVDPLLQELGHIDLTADSDDADGNSSTLRSVEQIVEERLVPVGTEQVEFFKDEYNRFTGLVSGFQAGEESWPNGTVNVIDRIKNWSGLNFSFIGILWLMKVT